MYHNVVFLVFKDSLFYLLKVQEDKTTVEYLNNKMHSLIIHADYEGNDHCKKKLFDNAGYVFLFLQCIFYILFK